MIFQADQAKAVMAGRKTLTLRTKRASTCPVAPSRAYALAVAGKPSTHRITVLSVDSKRWEQLDVRDARRANFKTTKDLYIWWGHLHGRFPRKDLELWLISFCLGEHTDTPRLLAARPGGPQYVSSGSQALRAAGEAVSALEQARMTRRSHEHAAALQDGSKRAQLAKTQSELEVLASMYESQRSQKAIRGSLRYLRTVEESG